ncbi:ecotropic viral integration site 5 ortholog [Lucilia cuprina]|uniref:ecotropic viral integration site 5 ortholog n=1 Tax=Lucilia cuprina TaxID=7375 RepID=UPI001F05435B|nr:ecotropic viral integration site 5 ortholog [Lucilia cuprina]
MTLTTASATTANNTQETISSSSKKMDVKCATAEENLPTSEMDLLAKLEAANKLIESDAKSLNSLHSTHSRKNSDTSQISITSNGNSVAEEDIWTTWATILNDWEGALKRKNPCVRELVRRGIPHHFRAIVWQQLCGANDADKKQYAEYIKATSACEKVIRRDIARTYPEVDFFKEKDGPGQEALFNVIKAYSLHDREVGYCQGSGFIVGLLLMQMPEEEAFAVLVQIMQQHRMRDMFKPSMSELGLCMYQLENLVLEQIPEMHTHFQQQNNSRQSSLDELCMKEEALKQRDEMVSCLLEELVKVRQSLAESEDQIRNLKTKIEELEEDKKTLRETTPDNSVAHLQDELIASKLREAEASLSLKDLKQRVQELSTQWQRQLQEQRNDHNSHPVDSTPKKLLTNLFDSSKSNEHTQKLEEELMTTRIREMETLTELKELRLKVMELETQVQVSTNQLRRQDEENKKIKEELDMALTREKEMSNKAREQQHRYSDLESRMKDELMNVKIKFTEQSQTVAELKQEISRLETKNSEMLAEGELRSNLDDSDKVRDLQDRIADLKAELTALKSRGKFLPVSKLRSSSIQSIESAESDFNDIMSMRRESTELSS